MKAPQFIHVQSTSPRHESVFLNPEYIVSITEAGHEPETVMIRIAGYDSTITVEGTAEKILQQIGRH